MNAKELLRRGLECGIFDDAPNFKMDVEATLGVSPPTFSELVQTLLMACPHGSMGEDSNGQLVFYTGCTRGAFGKVLPLKKKDVNASS